MVESSTALHDFAVLAQSDAKLELLVAIVADLKERQPAPAPTVELYGRPESGEIVILFRFAFAQYSAALRQKMEREANRLKGRLVEPDLLSPPDRNRFYGEKVNGCSAKQTASDDPKAAVEAFRGKMGLTRAGPALAVNFDSPEGLAMAWARCAAEGSLLLPARRLDPGTVVSLCFQVPGDEPMPATGRVLDPLAGDPVDRLRVAVEAGPELLRFAAKAQATQRKGLRRMPEGGRRVHPRFAACLEVVFESPEGLGKVWATDIGKGGLFVRSETPPPLRTKVRLRLKMPDGTATETDAEVVHMVGLEEARATRSSPGVGLAFATSNSLFLRSIEAYLATAIPRKPRILIADDDKFLRTVMSDALSQAGFEVETAEDGKAALERLASRLWEIDVLMADLLMPGLDGWCLIDRVRQMGPETDLKIVVLSATVSDAQLEQLRGPGGADEVIAKGTSMEEIVARVMRLIGRA